MEGAAVNYQEMSKDGKMSRGRLQWKRWVKEGFEHVCSGAWSSVVATKQAQRKSVCSGSDLCR